MNLWKLPQKLLSEAEIAAGAHYLRSRPQVVDLVLTKACNLACTFCKDYEVEGADNVTESQLQRAADQLFPSASRLSTIGLVSSTRRPVWLTIRWMMCSK